MRAERFSMSCECALMIAHFEKPPLLSRLGNALLGSQPSFDGRQLREEDFAHDDEALA